MRLGRGCYRAPKASMANSKPRGLVSGLITLFQGSKFEARLFGTTPITTAHPPVGSVGAGVNDRWMTSSAFATLWISRSLGPMTLVKEIGRASCRERV